MTTPPVYVSSSSAERNDTTPGLLTIPKPAGLADGHVLLAFINHSGADTTHPGELATIPAGFTAITPWVESTGNAVFGYYKVVTNAAGEPASYQFGAATPNDEAGYMLAYSGVDTANPTGTTTRGTAASSTSGLTLTLTTTTPNTTLVWFLGVDDNGARNWGLSAGLTTRFRESRTVTWVNSAVYEQPTTAAGEYSHTFTYAGGVTTAIGNGMAVSLRPIPDGGAGLTPVLLSRVVGSTGEFAIRTTDALSARIKYGTNTAVTTGVGFSTAVTVSAQSDSHPVVNFTALAAGDYYYRVGMTNAVGVETFDAHATVGHFTVIAAGSDVVRFAFSSCCDGASAAALDTIAALSPLPHHMFFTGDHYYADGTGTTLANFRTKMREKITEASHHKVRATIRTRHGASDHDGMNNNSTNGTDQTAWTNYNTMARELFAQDFPSTGFYSWFDDGPCRFILLDGRSFKSNPANADGTSKQALGATQEAWLQAALDSMPADMLAVIESDTAWNGAALLGDDAWLGYANARTRIGAMITASGKHVIMIAGDSHSLAADSGVNNAWGAFPVYVGSPLNNNSSIKGGAWSEGFYPDPVGATIVSQYGHVTVTRTPTDITAAFSGRSANGTVRITHTSNFTISTDPPPPTVAASGWVVGRNSFTGSVPPPPPPPPPPPGTTWFGWDTNSIAIPPRFSTIDADMRAWTDNTGLLNQANLDGLEIHNGDLNTSSNGQVIEWLHITGSVNVNHDNVTIKLCRIDDRVNVGVASGVTAIHCERGDENTGDRINNGYRGRIRMYRCLSYGLTDTWQSSAGGPASSGLSIFEDNCGHSPRLATDANQSSGYTHNDFIQVNSSGATIQGWRNTWLLWGMNNYTSLESCTRDSGPRWNDVDGNPLNVTGYGGQSGGVAQGRTNGGYLVGAGGSFTPLTVTVDGDYFRGYVYSYGHCQQGAWTWRNCLFAEDENEAGRGVVTRPGVVSWTNNRNYQTNAVIP